MEEVILVIHLIVAITLVAVILLQRSEGGALGIGGGGGGSMFSGRGAANLLTRATAVLAGVFFLTSIGLTLIHSRGGGSAFDELVRQQEADITKEQPASSGADKGSVLPVLPGGAPSLTPSLPVPPASPEAAAPQPVAPSANAPDGGAVPSAPADSSSTETTSQ